MKIAVNTRFLLRKRLGSTGNFTHEILRRLTVRYPEHAFLFFFDRAYEQQYIYAANVTPVVVSPAVRHPVLLFWWYQVSLPRALKEWQPDVFLSFDGLVPLAVAVPGVTIMPDIFSNETNYLSRKYYQHYRPQSARAAAKIIAVSVSARQNLIKQCHLVHLVPEKIVVVPPAAGEEFSPINFEKQVMVRSKYTQGEAYFLGVGLRKGSQELVNLFRAFDKFKLKTGSEVKLLIVGRQTWLTGYSSKAYKQMQFKADVIFTGLVEDTERAGLYGAAVATVYLPAESEFSLPVLEAQRCGCPVIAACTGAMPEVAGVMPVDPVAEKEITQALIDVYHELAVRARLVQEGLGNANRFSWEGSSEKIMRALEEVIQNKVTSGALL